MDMYNLTVAVDSKCWAKRSTVVCQEIGPTGLPNSIYEAGRVYRPKSMAQILLK